MIRKKLATSEGQRKKFRAVFSRVGKRINYMGYSEETILLKNVVDTETNKMITDHLWINFTKAFEKLVLAEGVSIEFEARVKKYKKGYVNSRFGIDNSKTDFKLSHLTKISVI